MPMHLNETQDHSIVFKWFKEPYYETTTKSYQTFLSYLAKLLSKKALGDNDL